MRFTYYRDHSNWMIMCNNVHWQFIYNFQHREYLPVTPKFLFIKNCNYKIDHILIVDLTYKTCLQFFSTILMNSLINLKYSFSENIKTNRDLSQYFKYFTFFISFQQNFSFFLPL